MLSDHDREALRKIHQDVSSEDPDFVQSFEADPLPSAPAHDSPYLALVWIWIFVGASILALLSLTLRSPDSVIVFAALAWYAASREFYNTGNEQKRRPERP